MVFFLGGGVVSMCAYFLCVLLSSYALRRRSAGDDKIGSLSMCKRKLRAHEKTEEKNTSA